MNPVSIKKHQMKSITFTIFLAGLVVALDAALTYSMKEIHAYAMLTIWIIIAIRNRKFIGRFLGVVIIHMMCWPLFLNVYGQDTTAFNRIAGIYFSQLDMALIIIFFLWFAQIYNGNVTGFHNKNA